MIRQSTMLISSNQRLTAPNPVDIAAKSLMNNEFEKRVRRVQQRSAHGHSNIGDATRRLRRTITPMITRDGNDRFWAWNSVQRLTTFPRFIG